jgi:hypothetical protein
MYMDYQGLGLVTSSGTSTSSSCSCSARHWLLSCEADGKRKLTGWMLSSCQCHWWYFAQGYQQGPAGHGYYQQQQQQPLVQHGTQHAATWQPHHPPTQLQQQPQAQGAHPQFEAGCGEQQRSGT